MKKEKRLKLHFVAGNEPMLVVFEPMGDEFPITPGHDIYVELPAEDLDLIEIAVWKTGVGVLLPYPGNNTVLDHKGKVIKRLWRKQRSPRNA